jgi:hypothetical protein
VELPNKSPVVPGPRAVQACVSWSRADSAHAPCRLLRAISHIPGPLRTPWLRVRAKSLCGCGRSAAAVQPRFRGGTRVVGLHPSPYIHQWPSWPGFGCGALPSSLLTALLTASLSAGMLGRTHDASAASALHANTVPPCSFSGLADQRRRRPLLRRRPFLEQSRSARGARTQPSPASRIVQPRVAACLAKAPPFAHAS